MSYELSAKIDNDKVFLINLSKIKNRLEPHFYTQIYVENDKKLLSSKYPLKELQKVTTLISDGTHFTPKYISSGIKFISVKNVRASKINYTKTKFISFEEAEKLDNRCKPCFNDVLLTKIGTIGLASIVSSKERFQIFVSVALLRPSEDIIPKFLEVFLNSRIAYLQFRRVLKGSGVPDLHLEDIRKVRLPVPPKRKQQEIADHFESRFNISKQKDKEANILEETINDYLFNSLGVKIQDQKENSIQNRIFTISSKSVSGCRLDPIYYSTDLERFNDGKYPSSRIGNIVNNFISGIGAGKQDQSDEVNGVVQIRPTNIGKDNELKFDKNVYVPKNFKGLRINVNDVLFNNTNSQELVGKTSILRQEGDFFFSNHITKIEVNDDFITADYLHIILNLYQKNKIFYSVCTNWNNQSGVGLDLLKSIKIPTPPLDIQIKISNHLADIRNQVKHLKEDAVSIIEQAQKDVEVMLLGDE